MFFVLSGYWIARMWKEKYSLLPNAYRTFVMSRWWRLAPLYVTTQLLAIAYSALKLPGSIDLQGLAIGWWVTQPLIIGSTQFGRLLPPSWSLDIEMQFYLIAPILVAGIAGVFGSAESDRSNFRSTTQPIEDCGISRWRLDINRSCLPLLLFLGWSVVLFASGTHAEASRWDLYGWMFVAGMLAHLHGWMPTRSWQWISLGGVVGLAAIAIALPSLRDLIWRSGSLRSSVPPAAVNLFMVSMAIVGIPFAISTVHRDATRWDRWFGDLSYPLYLFHWLPRQWYYSQVDWNSPAWKNIALLLVNFLISFVGSVALLHIIDRPIQNLRRKYLGNE